MKKLWKTLLVALLAISLTACNSAEVEPTPSTSPTSTTEVEEIDTNIYVPVGTESLDLSQLVLPLDDYTYETVTINEEKSDYDLNTKGEYELVLDLKDEKEEVIEEVNTVLVVDEKEVVEEKVEEQKAQKQRNAKVEVEDKELVAKPNDDGKTTVTDNPEKTETSSNTSSPNKAPSNNTASNNDSSSNTSSNSSSSSASSWNGGLSTDPTVYGLDPDNKYVQAAMNLVGQEGRCDLIAGDLYTALGESIGSNTYQSQNWNDLSGCVSIGDRITYTGLNGTDINHMAVYLGNGLALQGNWTGGVARIASVYQSANWYSVRTHNNYDDCVTCSTCNISTEEQDQDYQERLEEAAKSIDEEWCRVTYGWDMTSEQFAVCDDLVGADNFNWGY